MAEIFGQTGRNGRTISTGTGRTAPLRQRAMGAEFLPRVHDDTEADDEFDRVFPGCSFTHLLAVVSRDQLSVTIAVLSAIHNLGGGLDSLRLTRVAAKLEQRFRVTGLRPHQARLLSNQLAATAGIDHASVEHQILRVSAANGRSM